ncbi:hypothetical protein KSP39_PZI006591 [Platanthera zijinensis]|uniref:Uncharacterized protein n=1 Tax=Platanthera zijinensis TaxID=2320716 RepID=A0AAP0GAG0_9ASPA
MQLSRMVVGDSTPPEATVGEFAGEATVGEFAGGNRAPKKLLRGRSSRWRLKSCDAGKLGRNQQL